MRLLVVTGLIVVSLGCAPCGTYVLSDTTAIDAGGQGHNGSWREQCGVDRGSWGTWNLFGDGTAELWFALDAPGDRSWMGIDVEMVLLVPLPLLIEEAALDAAELGGSAALNPCIDCRQDVAVLTGGELEVLSVPDEDPCALEEGPELRLRWDLQFGEEGGPRYDARGTDAVLFSTFLSESCGGL